MFTCKIHLLAALRGSDVRLDELLQAFVVYVTRCPLGHLITWQAVNSVSLRSECLGLRDGRVHGIELHFLAYFFPNFMLADCSRSSRVPIRVCLSRGFGVCGGESNDRYLYPPGW